MATQGRQLISRRWAGSIIGVLLVILAILAVLFLWVGLPLSHEWIAGFLGLTEKNEILTLLGIGMGGVLIGLQVLAAYKRAVAMEDAANAHAAAAAELAAANRHTEWGQRQERLKTAVEHLGHRSDSVRMGGAYELFHLAQDTEHLRQTVLDILCGHIRWITGQDRYRETHKSNPSEEIHGLLNLLFVQDHEVFKGLLVYLRGSWLNGAALPGARLERADLASVHMRGAELRGHICNGRIFTRRVCKECRFGKRICKDRSFAKRIYREQCLDRRIWKARGSYRRSCKVRAFSGRIYKRRP